MFFPHPLALRRRAFTLVEIMIVVAVIALLASMAVPNFMRARSRAQATRILEDLRAIDGAVAQYAMERNKNSGLQPRFADLRPYLKRGTVLYITKRDVFGDWYKVPKIDERVEVPALAFEALSDVAPAEFWLPFDPPGPDPGTDDGS